MAAQGTKRPRRKQHMLLKKKPRSSKVLFLSRSPGHSDHRPAWIQEEWEWLPFSLLDKC